MLLSFDTFSDVPCISKKSVLRQQKQQHLYLRYIYRWKNFAVIDYCKYLYMNIVIELAQWCNVLYTIYSALYATYGVEKFISILFINY